MNKNGSWLSTISVSRAIYKCQYFDTCNNTIHCQYFDTMSPFRELTPCSSSDVRAPHPLLSSERFLSFIVLAPHLPKLFYRPSAYQTLCRWDPRRIVPGANAIRRKCGSTTTAKVSYFSPHSYTYRYMYLQCIDKSLCISILARKSLIIRSYVNLLTLRQ